MGTVIFVIYRMKESHRVIPGPDPGSVARSVWELVQTRPAPETRSPQPDQKNHLKFKILAITIHALKFKDHE